MTRSHGAPKHLAATLTGLLALISLQSAAEERPSKPVDQQQESASELAWRRYSDGPLAPEDFTGPVPDPVPVQDGNVIRAFTTTEFQIEYRYRVQRKGREYRLTATEFEFIASVVPGKSWTSATIDDRLLGHEQGHFDISELFARRVTREYGRLLKAGSLKGSGKTEEEARKQMAALALEKFQPHLEEWRLEQQRYDQETMHGSDPTKQQEWRRKILADLEATPAAKKVSPLDDKTGSRPKRRAK
jgi:hypothetical protein